MSPATKTIAWILLAALCASAITAVLKGPAPISILSLDMAKFLAYILAMKTANIGDLKNNLSKFINFVEQGEVIEICKRNIPIALLVPHGSKKTPNRTQLGCGVGTVQVKGDLTEPLIPEDSWDMLR